MKHVNYDQYRFSVKEKIRYSLEAAGIIAFITYIFYRSVIIFLCLLPLGILYIKEKQKELCKKRKQELNLEFREAILSVSAALGAGYSIENSFEEAAKDLEILYGKKAIIVQEWKVITAKMAANETLEKALENLANRSGVDDIQDFADVFITAKRTGGDLNGIIRKAADHIGEKIEIKREIETLMSAKVMEQKIMNAIPFMIILYVSFNSPGFLDVLYHNPIGIAVMTSCLILYFAAYKMAEKIVNIEM